VSGEVSACQVEGQRSMMKSGVFREVEGQRSMLHCSGSKLVTKLKVFPVGLSCEGVI
jgi:hypothetical protein